MPQLDRLGLRENPFNKNIDQRFFYADKNRAQILESTEHLIKYSSNFQVILGEPGIGKSHLLETLANRIDNNWRVAKITIAGQYNTQSLIQAILDSFGAIEDDRIELLEALETQLAEINQLGFKPVLFVDDAQALPVDCLRFLMQLSQQKQDEVPYINIVLFATTQVTEFLQSPELKGFRDIIHIATLDRLDKESLSAYLRHKMAVAGFDRETPFTPRIIDSIFSDSNGIPEKVDFFADKFLTSSGKADNYIEPDNQQDDLNTGQETNLMDSFNDDDLTEDRNDRAEVQLSRLTEKFEEIEQLGEQQEDELFTEGDSDYNEEFQTEDELSDSGLAKFVIPVALIGIIIVALLVMNSVFEQSEQSSVQGEKEQIDLLPLELPPENLVVNKGVVKKQLVEEKPATQPELEITQPSESLKEENSETITKIAVNLPETKQEIIQTEKPVVAEQVASPVIRPIVDETPKPVVPMIAAPELSSVEPEPVIGSNTRQYITITGKNLEKDTLLLVSWPGNKKEFSEKQTPGQWQYVNKNKIKLHLNTGIASQQWTVSAKSAESIQSPFISFDVVKPFISQLSIKKVLPNPFIGSDKRQAVTIEGDGFSKRTVIELRWDKNKKHFSSRLTPGQFEFISSKRIKLFIATGIKKRKWTVVAISPTGKSSTSSFLVTDKSLDEKKIT
ncbi:MAG: AAA family ATPase, partial [Thiotrichaceae bacterium]|nr:AAA family ATPase [Thiotrichaceae bacterium]